MGRSEYELAAWPRRLPLLYAFLVVNTFSCSSNRIRRFAARNSALSAAVTPA